MGARYQVFCSAMYFECSKNLGPGVTAFDDICLLSVTSTHVFSIFLYVCFLFSNMTKLHET